MRGRAALISAVVLASLALPATASAWKLDAAKFLKINASLGQEHKISLTKCQGGKVGVYKLRYDHFFLAQEPKYDLYLKLDMRVRFPITPQFKHTHVEKFELTYSNDFDDVANEVHDTLVSFYNSQIKLKLSPDGKHVITHNGPLEIEGQEVISPGTHSAPFNPKP